MRYVNIVLGLVMLSFVAVQYNDPDGPLWMAIYMVPAAWAFAAAFRLPKVRSPAGMRWLWASVAVGFATLIFYWPGMPGFWRKEVWWVEETAREGMGVMVGFGVLLVVLATALRKPQAAATGAHDLRARTPGS
jgi:Transmembrane family 220, helix